MDVQEQVERRRAQNRMAQRRFRQRHPQKTVEALPQNHPKRSSITLQEHETLSFGEQTSPDLASFMAKRAMDAHSEPLSGSDSPDMRSLSNTMTFMNVNNAYTPDAPDTITANTVFDFAPSACSELALSPISPGSKVSDLSGGGSSSHQEINLDALIDQSSTRSTASLGGWFSSLHLAAQKGHHGIVSILLEHGVDCNEKDSDGLTPMLYAIIGDHEDVARSLLSRGARFDNVDGKGRSAIHCAVIYRRETMLKLFSAHLVAQQAPLDSYDISGMTPLHLAVDTNFEAGVQILLRHGANVHHKARKS